MSRYALANQITTLNGVIELPRSDTTTGPLPWSAALNWVSARCKSPYNGTLRGSVATTIELPEYATKKGSGLNQPSPDTD
jgi:hypothetical protein